jgi:hypothetical protein
MIYVLLDAIFVRLIRIHWFAPVDIDQPSIGSGSSDFAAKKTPEARHLQCAMLLNIYTLHS